MSELLHSPDAELAALKARVARLERLEEQGAPLLPGRIIGCTLAAAVLLAAGYLCFCRPAGKEETA